VSFRERSDGKLLRPPLCDFECPVRLGGADRREAFLLANCTLNSRITPWRIPSQSVASERRPTGVRLDRRWRNGRDRRPVAFLISRSEQSACQSAPLCCQREALRLKMSAKGALWARPSLTWTAMVTNSGNQTVTRCRSHLKIPSGSWPARDRTAASARRWPLSRRRRR
jgi:hypothetical protein